MCNENGVMNGNELKFKRFNCFKPFCSQDKYLYIYANPKHKPKKTKIKEDYT